MRVFFLSRPVTILLAFVMWGVLQVCAALICLNLPDHFFSPDTFLFRTYGFEQEGRIYQKLFKVQKWKHLLPDGAAAWKKKGFRKKKLQNMEPENLSRFLLESSRAEMTHWLAILPFWVFGLFMPASAIWMMFLYAIAANLPCIITQRYNRPRIERLLNKMNVKK